MTSDVFKYLTPTPQAGSVPRRPQMGPGSSLFCRDFGSVKECLEWGLGNVERFGWRRDELGAEDGVCAMGAMLYGPSNVPHLALAYLAKAAGVPSWMELGNWNDAEGRTQTDVIDAYRDAIKYAEEDGL